MGKCTVDNRDDYYRRAKEDGYRARSAYKLIDLDRQFDLLNPQKVRRVCDLCAAPGSWSQVLADRLISAKPREPSQPADTHIVSVDLQRVAPIPGVTVIQGDITSLSTIEEILSRFDGDKADLVLCDGAGELSACVIDEYLQAKLVLTALQIARKIMRTGATFVCKVLVGDSYRDIVERKLCALFERVETVKPPSSRASSSEHFAVCINMLSDEQVSSGKRLANMMLKPMDATPAQVNNSKTALFHALRNEGLSRLDDLKVPESPGATAVKTTTNMQQPFRSPANCFGDKNLFRHFYSSHAAAKLNSPWNSRRQ